MILTASLTPWCQDSVKVAYSDLKEILILASKGEKVDSLIAAYELQIEIKDSQVIIREDQLKVAQELIEKQYSIINDQQAKIAVLERRKRILSGLSGALGGIILIETLILII